MSSIFERLQFPASLSNETIAFSDATIKTMNLVPKLLNDWQYADIANTQVGGYFKNPVSDYANNIITLTTQIKSNTINNLNLGSIFVAANTTGNTLNSFNQHTDRISGVTQPNADTALLPHYNTAIGLGKLLVQMTFQSDGITNNAVMIGSLGSMFKSNNLISYYNTLSSYPALIEHSVINDGMGNLTSNLTSTQINQIVTDLNYTNSQLTDFITSDVNFYNNSKAVSDDFHTVRAFSNMGQTENDLVQNLNGSDKLLQRLN